eukprot:SAG11_NODE_1298_length_5265_cov_3.096787_6_plen_116_part_00
MPSPTRLIFLAQAIANSFTKPADGEAEVRLFNLSPDTKTASMSVDGKESATDVAFTVGSGWSAMDSHRTHNVLGDGLQQLQSRSGVFSNTADRRLPPRLDSRLQPYSSLITRRFE